MSSLFRLQFISNHPFWFGIQSLGFRAAVFNAQKPNQNTAVIIITRGMHLTYSSLNMIHEDLWLVSDSFEWSCWTSGVWGLCATKPASEWKRPRQQDAGIPWRWHRSDHHPTTLPNCSAVHSQGCRVCIVSLPHPFASGSSTAITVSTWTLVCMLGFS